MSTANPFAKKADDKAGDKPAIESKTSSVVLGKAAIGNMADSEQPVPTRFYSSLPIAHYTIAQFEFVNGYLSLTESEADEFEALMAAQPVTERARINRLSAAPTAVTSVSMTQGIDTSDNAPAAPAA